MRISDEIMEKLLVRSGVATEERIKSLVEEAKRTSRPLMSVALENEVIDEVALTKAYAENLNIPFVELHTSDIPIDTLNKIPERIARQYNAILFKIDEKGTCHLAMDDPDDVQAINFIEKQIGTNTIIYIAPHSNILATLEAYRRNIDEELNQVINVQRETTSEEKTATPQSLDEDSPVAKTVNLILESAIKAHASDVHIEPREGYVQVRFRIDGILREVNHLPKNVMDALISRIKILSTLKIDERRVPQDGRFKIDVGGSRYALRVSTLPITDGEKVVLRILDESDKAVSLESLGFWGQPLASIKSALTESDGMILITGPTGSGKSTTLFSALSILNTPKVNISTIEDPVEYKIPGVNQTQTNAKAGMTFANGLRALLRQDPNIIMIGEIRDSETANLGVQAALTGHLVFSTLHTNDAATCLPRLLDMGIEPFLIASTVRIVVGQRLVRRLRHETRQSYTPTEEEKQKIINLFGLQGPDSFKIIHELEKQAAADGIGGASPISTDENGINMLWKAKEDDDEDGAIGGYKSRIGIHEVLDNSPSVQKLIVANATSASIQEQAIKEGMIKMQIDGLIKALRGETTIEEIIRATKE